MTSTTTTTYQPDSKTWRVEVPTCTHQARIDRYGQVMADLSSVPGAGDLTFYSGDFTVEVAS